MKIPADDIAKMGFVQDVLSICMSSLEDRKAAYRTLKQYYLYGQESGTSVDENVFGVVNKIFPQIDKTCSMLYSADSTRFGVEIARSAPQNNLDKVDALIDAVMDQWHASETDNRFGEALRWSMVYGSMFIKARPKNQDIKTDIVEPHHIGVYREDLMGLENQEAYYHEYRITKSELIRQLTVAGFPNPENIANAALESPTDGEESVTQPIDRIVTSSALPTVQGEINTFIGSRLGYMAKLKQPMCKMYELYVFDDELDDYRVFTLAHPWVPVFDRPIRSMFLPEESPLVQVCPYPMYGYFWGMSPVERLLSLQMLRNTRWDQVQHIMEMEANPAKFVTGDLTADAAEIQAAFDTPGGLVTSAQTGSDAKPVAPTKPDDLFAEVNYLDSQFDEAIGTTDTMAGKGESGVRSEGHANQLLRSGSTRAKTRALIVERQLEELATLMLKIMRKYSDRTYVDDKGQQFLAEQFTDEFMVRVDAHSSSPIFMQDMSQLAFALFKAKAITREKLIDMLPAPMKALLKRELKTKIEPAEAKAAAQQRQLELVTGKKPAAAGKK